MAIDKKNRKRWYFARLGFLAVPQGSFRVNRGNQRGTLFTQYYLLEATSFRSAFKKADLILSICENRDRGARLSGKPVHFVKIGIFDLEPLYQKLADGVELFDESEPNITYGRAKGRVVSKNQRRRLIEYGRRNGGPSILDVFWGEEFEKA